MSGLLLSSNKSRSKMHLPSSNSFIIKFSSVPIVLQLLILTLITLILILLLLLLILTLPSYNSRYSLNTITTRLSLTSTLLLSNDTCSPLISRNNSHSTDQQDSYKFQDLVFQSLVHYATSDITPQQTLKEILITAQILRRKSPCNFLVFGLGHDSLLWSTLNYGGRTVFLEEDEQWIKIMSNQLPCLEIYHVNYTTKLRHEKQLFRRAFEDEEYCVGLRDPSPSECELSLKGVMPDKVYEEEYWDMIMVDAPTGYKKDAPGRMTAIYTAGLMARRRRDGGETEVFVHDVDRAVEDKYSKAFLCEKYIKEEEGKLRHFTIPGSRENRLGLRHYCPA